MSVSGGPDIVTDNLLIYIDSANEQSYISGSEYCTNLVDGTQGLITASWEQSQYAHDDIIRYNSDNLGEWVFPPTESMGVRGNMIHFTQSFMPSQPFPFGAGGWFSTDSNAPRSGSLFMFVSSSYGGDWTGVSTNAEGTSLTLRRRTGFGSDVMDSITTSIIPYTMFYIHVNFISSTAAQAFLNGKLVFDSTSLTNIGTSATNFLIGSLRIAGPSPWDFFVGSCAIAYVTTGSLTEQEVLQNFNATRGRFGI